MDRDTLGLQMRGAEKGSKERANCENNMAVKMFLCVTMAGDPDCNSA